MPVRLREARLERAAAMLQGETLAQILLYSCFMREELGFLRSAIILRFFISGTHT